MIVFDLQTGRLLGDGHADDGTIASLRWLGIYDLEVAAVDRIGQRPR